MARPTIDAEMWALRGEEMRAIASEMRNGHCQAMALQLAADYERMARQAVDIQETLQAIDNVMLWRP